MQHSKNADVKMNFIHRVGLPMQQQAVGAATGTGRLEASEGHTHEIQQSCQAPRSAS